MSTNIHVSMATVSVGFTLELQCLGKRIQIYQYFIIFIVGIYRRFMNEWTLLFKLYIEYSIHQVCLLLGIVFCSLYLNIFCCCFRLSSLTWK